MAPEVLSGTGPGADPAIDLWAMGVILYVLVLGRYPFRGKTEAEIKKNITGQKLRFPKLGKRVTAECKKLLTGLLEKDPATRLKVNDVIQSEWFALPYLCHNNVC